MVEAAPHPRAPCRPEKQNKDQRIKTDLIDMVAEQARHKKSETTDKQDEVEQPGKKQRLYRIERENPGQQPDR